jgi:hypothetical protein
MAIVVSPPSKWDHTAGRICRDALEHLNVVGSGDATPAEDQVLALRALELVLKDLPLHGYQWPKLSGETTLAWSAVSPDIATVPADFYGYPVLHKTVNGQQVPLISIPHGEWVSMLNRDATAESPTHFYLGPDSILHYWPIPQADPQVAIQYQRNLDDPLVGDAPDLPDTWINALCWGVAAELRFKYGLQQAERVEIVQTWEVKKSLALGASVQTTPIAFSVAD